MTRQLPILFKGEMVRAILAGLKTNTRRVNRLRDFGPSTTPGYDWEFRDRRGLWRSMTTQELIEHHCPYGKPGDELWVRETFSVETNYDTGSHYEPPHNDGRPINWVEDDECGRYWQQCHYRATDEAPDLCCEDPKCATCERDDCGPHWKPSIRMPRWASRIRLTVTEVRVERVQSISEADAKAEGVEAQMVDGYGCWKNYEPGDGTWCNSARDSFGTLWRSINDGREGCAWDVNPYVWCVRFEVYP